MDIHKLIHAPQIRVMLLRMTSHCGSGGPDRPVVMWGGRCLLDWIPINGRGSQGAGDVPAVDG